MPQLGIEKVNQIRGCLASEYTETSIIHQKRHSGRASYLACLLRWGTLTQLSITQGHVGKEKVQPWGIGWDSLPPPIHPLVFRAQCFWPPTKILCHHVSRVADIHRPHDEEEE